MNKSNVILVTFVLVAVNLVIGLSFLMKKGRSAAAVAVANPQRLLEAVQARPLYYTRAAQEELRAHRPELLNAAEEGNYFAAAQNPALFRQLDRRLRFATLLLAGDPGPHRPLLRHLIETRDWTVTFIDQAQIVFQRSPAAAWQPEQLAAMKAELQGESRAVFLIGVANKLLALGKTKEAKTQLDEALAITPQSPDGLTQLALYHAQIGQWLEALTTCDRALAVQRSFPAALAAKAQILFGAKRFNDALDVSERAVDTNPRDPAVLFLDAKIAHEAHAFTREIRSLEKLIAVAESEGQPASGYYIYLAQAYAADSQALPAIEQFEKAAAAGDLSAEQRKFVEESIARIKSRTGS